MLAEPDDLDRAEVAATLATHWGITGSLSYLPVGFGTHHYRAGELVARRRDVIDEVFAAYDALVPAVRATADRWVVTHGEPHAGNVLWLIGGGFRLIDWDTVALGPPERDLWMFALDSAAAELYRLRWWLEEVCLYVTELHGAHVDDANTRASWRELRRCLAQQPTSRAAR